MSTSPFVALGAILLSFALGAGSVNAQDAAAGEKVFKKCVSCHKIGDGAANSVGPVLNNIVDRAAGSYEGYKYSKSMLAAGETGLVWTEENLINYLKDPKKFLRSFLDDKKAKTKMALKLKDEKARMNVVAYLQSLSS